MQVLQFKQFRWPKHAPERAVYVCIACGVEVDPREKPAMVAAGEWRPGPHPQFPDAPVPAPFAGHASFHIWAGYSYSPNATWGQLCTEFVAANAQGPEHLKTFVNTVLGEPWQDRGDAPEWQRMYARREPYPFGTCPAGVRFLTCGVDVQKDRLVYEVVGWGREKRSWSIEVGELHGDSSDTSAKGPWQDLERLLVKTFPHDAGGDLPIVMLAIDSGFNTQVVYNWARRYPMQRVIAVRGVSTAHVLIGAPSKVDVTVSGKRLKRGYKVWPIATHLAKSELYGWLAMKAPTAEELAAGSGYPPGFCHFPEHGEDYFRQLTAEQLVSHKSRKGYTQFTWELIPGRDNHFLDARVYARAAAAVVGLDRFRESDWEAFEARLGTSTPAKPVAGVPPTAGGSSATPATLNQPLPPKPPAAPPRRPGGGWFGGRRGSWLKGRR
jgi:phage terminase large subunit GpA-like protein